MLLSVIILLLPVYVLGNIRVDVQTSPLEAARVQYFGANVNLIGDEEIASFGLDNNSLKEAVRAYTGLEPSHAFVKTPTVAPGIPENLFDTYQFSEVTRQIIPTDEQYEHLMINVTKELDLDSEATINPTNEKLLHKIILTSEAVDTVKIRWWNSEIVSRSDNILHSIDFGESNENNLSFEVPLGEDVNKQRDIKFAMESEVGLNAGQTVEAILEVTKVYLVFEVKYTVSLAGHIACYFPEEYNGKQYWGFDINDVLREAEKPTTLNLSQLIRLEFYINPRIALKLTKVKS